MKPSQPSTPTLAHSRATDIWDTQLIQKYDLTGPRYTSYPTALKFSEDYSEQDWLSASSTNTEDRLSLYIHIPFCDTICYYCGCNKIVTANRAHAKRYIRYLKQEIEMKAAKLARGPLVDLIHFGGGTPTYLSDDQLQELLEFLRSKFDFADNELECAIELHPQTANEKRLETLASLGFNRVSIGVQDFSADVQRAVNRYNSIEEVKALLASAKEHGYKSRSIDLIYGLPRQSRTSFAETLTQVIALSPDRISIFNYAHMPDLFKSQRQIKANELPPAHEKLEMLHDAILKLANHGYAYIGMDHFAKKDDELYQAQLAGTLHRNFQGYSTHNHKTLHAFGLSAISTIDNHYIQNVKRLDQYYQHLDNNKLPIAKGYVLTRDDELRRYIINTLLCSFELSFEDLQTRFDVNFFEYFSDTQEAISHLIDDRLIEISNNKLVIKPKGRILARSVCKLFDAYARTDVSLSSRFSRII